MTQGPPQPERSVVAYLKDRDKACPSCGYNLRGVGKPVCPECGWELKFTTLSPSAFARRRWFWLLGFAGGVGGLFLVLMSVVPAAAEAELAAAGGRQTYYELVAWSLTAAQAAAVAGWWFGAAWLRRRSALTTWSLALAISWPLAVLLALMLVARPL